MMDRVRSNDQKEIPLFLLPQVIAKQIRTAGDRIYRISVKRTHWHHYNVSIRTKRIAKELRPETVASFENTGMTATGEKRHRRCPA